MARTWPNQTFVLNLARIQAVEQLRQQLEAEGIGVLYLKGAAFLDTLYPDLGARPMVDVDLLVRPADRSRAGALLLERGFERLSVDQRPVTVDEHYEWVFVRREPVPLVVEIHARLCQVERFDIDEHGLWQRAVRRRTPYREVPTLSSEDCLLHVSIHEGLHSFIIDERSAEDIRRIVEVWGVDWDLLVHRATAWHARTNLYVSLRAARALRAARVPDQVLARLRPSALRRAWLALLIDLQGSGRSRFAEWSRLRQLAVVLLTVEHPINLARFVGAYAWLRTRDLWGTLRQRLGPGDRSG